MTALGTGRADNGFSAMRVIVSLVLLLAGCSRGTNADLPSIGEARSLAAEWALVNRQAAQGHLTATYTETARAELRTQLRTTARSLSQSDSSYGEEIRSLLALPDDASADALKGHADRLKQIEDGLESA